MSSEDFSASEFHNLCHLFALVEREEGSALMIIPQGSSNSEAARFEQTFISYFAFLSDYSLILLQFLFQFYVFRARSNWHKLLPSPCLYCIIYICCFVYVYPYKVGEANKIKIKKNSFVY